MRSRTCRFLGWILGVAISLLSGGSPLSAEVREFTLPSQYADFALNPETGTIAAVDPDQNEVVFIKPPGPSDSGVTVLDKAKVGSTPCAVCHKRFGDRRVFVVVCSQDANLYVFQADGPESSEEDFGLLKKISVDVAGVSSVFSSLNPEDPFVYFCHGSGHDSVCGVVSLRDMKSHGTAFDDAMDGTVSATGEFAYRRGPWSPSGFESLVLTSGLKGEKPTFTRLFYDHTSVAGYLPDPYGRITISGRQICDVTLEKNLGALNFDAMGFFRSPPIIVGMADSAILACSYNTFTQVGTAVKITLGDQAGRELPRGVPGQADFKRLTRRTRILTDDERDTIFVGDRNRLTIVPLAELSIPDEPLLLAELEGPATIPVEQPVQLNVKVADPAVEVFFEDLPLGMKADGTKLDWKPTAEQVGISAITVTLKSGELQKSLTMTCQVGFPFMELPFVPTGFEATADGKQAVLWEGARRDRFGRPQAAPPGGRSSWTIALIEPESGRVVAERQSAEMPGRIVPGNEVAVLLPAQSGITKCDVLKLPSLERIKTLATEGPILNAEFFGDKLLLSSAEAIDVYAVGTLERVRRFSNVSQRMNSNDGRRASTVTSEGISISGVVMDRDLKPTLIRSAAPIPVLNPGGRQMPTPTAGRAPEAEIRLVNGRQRIASATTAAGVVVALDRLVSSVQVPGSVHTQRTLSELILSNSGSGNEQCALFREYRYGAPQESETSLLAIGGDTAYVVDNRRLFRRTLAVRPAEQNAPLRLSERQTEIGLSEGKNTALNHAATGGTGKIEFTLVTAMNGVSIDDRTGTVTVDNAAVMQEAVTFLARSTPLNSNPSAPTPVSTRAAELLGRAVTGIPIALPIGVTATDSDLATDTLLYHLILDVPITELEKQREVLAKANAASRPTPTAGPPRQTRTTLAAGGGGATDPIFELQGKVEALEARIDLLTSEVSRMSGSAKPRAADAPGLFGFKSEFLLPIAVFLGGLFFVGLAGLGLFVWIWRSSQ